MRFEATNDFIRNLAEDATHMVIVIIVRRVGPYQANAVQQIRKNGGDSLRLNLSQCSRLCPNGLQELKVIVRLCCSNYDDLRECFEWTEVVTFRIL